MKHEGTHIVAHRMGKNGAFVLAQCVYIPFESFLRLNSFFFSLFVCGYCCVYGIALVVARERERERAKERNRKIWYFKMDGNDTKAWRHKQAQESPYTFSKMIRPAFNNRNEQQQTQPFLKPAFSENPIEISRQNTFSNTHKYQFFDDRTHFLFCVTKNRMTMANAFRLPCHPHEHITFPIQCKNLFICSSNL